MAKSNGVIGVIWSAVERFSVQGIQFVIGIVMARLLLPSDFGLIAMLSIFMLLSQVFVDAGFGNALTQKKNRSDIDYCTVFYTNIILSITLYCILFFTAPFIASFYNLPELTSITRVIGLTLVIDSLGIIQNTKLSIQLDFRRMSVASLTSAIISGTIGITLAYTGYGVWAIVAQLITNNIIRVALLWVVSKWRPSPIFSWESFKGLFKFSYKLLISSIIHQIYTNIYALIIGKKYAAAELGYYSKSYSFANFPSANISYIFERAAYPVLCEHQDNDTELNNLFIKYMRMACYIVFPLMVGLAAVAKPLIIVLLTDNWIESVPLLQILAIAFMWDPIMRMNHLVINAKGKSNYFLTSEIIKKIAGFTILFATIPFGVKVMCMGLILYSFADMGIIIYYNTKVTKIGILRQIKEIFPLFLITIIMGGLSNLTVYLLSSHSSMVQLISAIIVGILSYWVMSAIFKFKEYSFIKSKLRSIL